MTQKSHRPILVTGASSGIGNCLVKTLAARGHTVYGTARKDRDLAALAEIENVVPIKMDVRDPQQVLAARDFVASKGSGLYGLVHNAGIGPLGLYSTWTDAEMLDLFDVNVFGIHRVTNAFLGLLLPSRGRIVVIGSQGGMITKKYFGPYTMTKHALEAYTVSLDEELTPYGVRVSIVQPGGIVSSVGESAMPGIIARFQRAQAPFKEEAEAVLASFSQPEQPSDGSESETNRKPSSPEIVAVAVHDALVSETPKLRYLVGTTWEGDRVINGLIERLLDENDNPQHDYSRDELVALLDRHIAERRGESGI
jgi:NAD(P)-dependent dehydrogenase (short-subunit alcohol dehydrogenase family)